MHDMDERLTAILQRQYRFCVEAEDDDGGWWIWFPDLPGCQTRADSWEEIGRNARAGFEDWVTTQYELGGPIPEPSPGTDGLPWPVEAFVGGANAETDGLKTTAQAAADLGVTPMRVRQLSKRQGIGRKFGRDLWFSDDDIERMKRRPQTVGRPAESSRKGK